MMFSFRAWLAVWLKQRNRRRPLRACRTPLNLECLEDRLAPAVMTVNTIADADKRDNFLSFRESIELANGTLLYANLTAVEKAQVDLGNQGKGPTPDKSTSNTIRFRIGNAAQTIQIQGSPLPHVVRLTIIEGSAPAGLPNQKIIVDGTKLDPTNGALKLNVADANGIVLDVGRDKGNNIVSSSTNSAIYGLTVQNFYTDGIRVYTDYNHIGGSNTNSSQANTRLPHESWTPS